MNLYNESLNNGLANVSMVSDHVDYDIVTLESLVPAWSKLTLLVFIIVAMVIGLPGNSLVLLVLLKVKLKTSTDWFVIFIALCDFISLSVNGPLYIVYFFCELRDTAWNQVMCKFHIYIIHCVFLQSSFLITCVGLDRYYKTCKPHTVFFTPQSALISSLVLSLVSAAFNTTHFSTTKLNIYGKCALDHSKSSLRMASYGVLLLFIVISSGVIGVVYSRIAIQIRRRMKVGPMESQQNNGPSTYRKENRSIVSLFSRSFPNETGLKGSVLRRVTRKNSERKYHTVTKSGPVTDIVTRRTMVVSDIRTQSGIDNDMSVTPRPWAEMSDISNYVLFSKCSNNDARQTGPNSDKNGHASATIVINQPRQHLSRSGMRQKHDVVGQRLNNKTRQINKTSKIMGAITLVYIVSSVLPTIAVAILTVLKDVKQHSVGRVVVFWMIRVYLVNNFANPVFYVSLSSAFRKRVVDMVCKICNR